MRFTWTVFFVIVFALSASSQINIDYFVVANGNLYLPYTEDKGIFPILGYDKDSSPKVLIGGLGLGFSAWIRKSGNVSLKVQANMSRSVYWESYLFTDGPLLSDVTGTANVSTADYNLGLIGTMHYSLSPSLTIGAGLGTQMLIASSSFLRDDLLLDESRNLGRNKYYKTLMPTLPLEFSLHFERWLINLRFEQPLLNRIKKDLAKYKKDYYGLLFFELGYKISN